MQNTEHLPAHYCHQNVPHNLMPKNHSQHWNYGWSSIATTACTTYPHAALFQHMHTMCSAECDIWMLLASVTLLLRTLTDQ